MHPADHPTDVAGYEIGRKLGPPLYEREGRILKRKYFDQTTAFFDKHGNKALVIGRFVPFVRTYVTVVAGVTRMDRVRNIDKAIIVILAFSVIPIAYEWWKHRRVQSLDRTA